MFKYGISCALEDLNVDYPVTLRGSISDICQTANQLGYDGIEIHLENPKKHDWDEIKQVTRDYNLKVPLLGTGRELGENGLHIVSDDEEIRKAAIKRLKEYVDCASLLGSMVVIASMRGKIKKLAKKHVYLDYHEKCIKEIAEYANSKGVFILVENVLSFITNYLNTVRDVQDFVSNLNCENVGVHIDTYSMMMEDNQIEKNIVYCKDRLRYVHFSDTARLYPGGGNVDFKRYMHALSDIGYKGWISMECVPLPTSFDCAKNSIDYLKAMEIIVAIERNSSRFK
ncbi:MAG TPA: sugar phosphate isomerase/epimerase [Clostridiaceae bacterium]|nr:sugar phosphate isomerase/epimerase [Clostridiaceae bacterium]